MPGSKVSLRDVLEGFNGDCLSSDNSLEHRVFFLDLFEPLDLRPLDATVLVSPAVVSLLGDLESFGNLGQRKTLGEQNVRIAELLENLIWAVSTSCHGESILPDDGRLGSHSGWSRLRGSGHYDLFVDFVGNRTIAECKHVLTATGTYVAMAGPLSRTLRGSLFGGKQFKAIIATDTAKDLQTVTDLALAGHLSIPVTRTFGFNETPVALAELLQGHARGKLVIEVLG